MKYKILIIDDESAILDMLSLQFQSEGYLVDTALNASQALEKLSNGPDLLLLDINMEGINGLELCTRIREYITCPILFLTARVSEQDKINGLMVGGDDYITKPFSMNELFARVKAHLRREERSHTKTIGRFSDELVIDYGKRVVFVRGNEIELSNKEFEIIKLLSMNAGQVFDREKIYEAVWGFESDGDNAVIKEHIRKIRMKIGTFTETIYLETVWGVGYRWKK